MKVKCKARPAKCSLNIEAVAALRGVAALEQVKQGYAEGDAGSTLQTSSTGFLPAATRDSSPVRLS